MTKKQFVIALVILVATVAVIATAQTASLIYSCIGQSGQLIKISSTPITCQASQTLLTWPASVPVVKKPIISDGNGTLYGDSYSSGLFIFNTPQSDPGTPVLVQFTINGIVDGSNDQYWFDSVNCSGNTYLPLGANGEHIGSYYPPLQGLTYPGNNVSFRQLHSHRSVSSQTCFAADANLWVGEVLGESLSLPTAPLTMKWN